MNILFESVIAGILNILLFYLFWQNIKEVVLRHYNFNCCTTNNNALIIIDISGIFITGTFVYWLMHARVQPIIATYFA